MNRHEKKTEDVIEATLHLGLDMQASITKCFRFLI